MKYVHFYEGGSFCESESFKNKIGIDGYAELTDEEYDELINGAERRAKAEQLRGFLRRKSVEELGNN